MDPDRRPREASYRLSPGDASSGGATLKFLLLETDQPYRELYGRAARA